MIELTPVSSETWDAPEPHTPTPWSEFAENGDWWIQQCDAEGNPVGDTAVSGADDMSTADMLFIVQACNAHDALVLALQEQIELWEMAKPALDLADARQHQVKFTEFHDPIGLLRAALAKARP